MLRLHAGVSSTDRPCLLLLLMERTGIEPVASDLQIPGSSVELGQIRSVNAKLRWVGEAEIRYSGTRFGTRFLRVHRVARSSGETTLAQATAPSLVASERV